MPEIEFIDTEPPDADASAPRAPRNQLDVGPRMLLALIPAALALLGAALTLVAPFRPLERIVQPQSSSEGITVSFFTSVDGWGRYSYPPGQSGGGHSLRYGLVLMPVCGLLAVVALLLTLSAVGGHRRAPWSVTAGRGLAVAAASALISVGAVTYLDYRTLVDSLASFNSSGQGTELRASLGSCWWLIGAAAVVALLVLVSSAVVARLDRKDADLPGVGSQPAQSLTN